LSSEEGAIGGLAALAGATLDKGSQNLQGFFPSGKSGPRLHHVYAASKDNDMEF
jgi:hypothetical protein